jgi:hypothetical protein
LKCLYRLNGLYLDQEAYFTFQDTPGVVALADYKAGDCDVRPVSDPTVVTDMQRLGRAQYVMQFLGKGWDDMAIMTRALEGAGVPDIEGLKAKGEKAPDPKMLIESKRLDLEAARLELEKGRAVTEDTLRISKAHVEEAQKLADIELTSAQARKTMLEAAGLGAALLPQIEAMLHQAMTDLLAQAGAGEPQAAAPQLPAPQQAAPEGMSDAAGPGPVQSGELQPLDQPASDQAVPGVPPGPAGDVGQDVDGGGDDAGSTAMQGGASGGVVGP